MIFIHIFSFFRDSLECSTLSSTKDIVVNANSCINYPCHESSSCSSHPECELCLQCLTQVPGALNHLHRSYREHMHYGNVKRLFPSSRRLNYHDESIVNQLSPANRLSMKWFQAKCDADSAWC